MKSSSPFPPFNADTTRNNINAKYRTFIPFRVMIPNIITIMAIVSGMSSIQMAFERRFYLAVILLLVAAILDGVDGRVARAMRTSSRFGEQLDSLADAINFGVVPAFLVYIYLLEKIGRIGWLAVLIYSVACCLRLARFNVMLGDNKNIPKWRRDYFIGVPAPAGGCLLLLPIYLGFLGMPVNTTSALIFCLYTLGIAILTISNLPVWNGKSIRSGVRRDVVIPIQLFIVIYFVLLVSYMWHTLAVSAFIYLAFLPLSGYFFYKKVHTEKLKIVE